MNNNSSFTKDRIGKKGTKEWSDMSYNICAGCEHDCLYCYAKAMRSRFDEAVREPGYWRVQRLNPRQKLGSEIGPKGVVMFPTTHDLVPEFVDKCLTTIQNLLQYNKVLVVTKPHLSVITKLCRKLAGHKDKILFRFTIGALDANLCAFWEPGAPMPQERIQALKHAHEQGFATSVSIEPMLDSVDATLKLVAHLAPQVTDTIWIGKMQRIPTKLNLHVPGFLEAKKLVKHRQRDDEILRLVSLLKGNRKIQWKDSIKAGIEKASAELASRSAKMTPA